MARTSSPKKGKVYFDNTLAGVIEQREGLYIFAYDQKYREMEGNMVFSRLTAFKFAYETEPYTRARRQVFLG